MSTESSPYSPVSPDLPAEAAPSREAQGLGQLTATQWKSGAAAWLGWLFDGLDMHLYTLVAVPFVALLLDVDERDASVTRYSSIIQAAFLVGWALGGGFFGRIGDVLGRSQALILTILTYATFTGLSFFAQTWWHLMIFRFLAALGIGGEWAVGASLLSETWPKHWRPWMAAVLQTGVNLGTMLACLAGFLLAAFPNRYVFLVGVLPAFLVLWIRRAVPEPPEWHAARELSGTAPPSVLDLFRGEIRKTTLMTMLVCSLALTAHWAFMFWHLQHLKNLPDLASWTSGEKQRLASKAFFLVMFTSIIGNFLAAGIARFLGYRRAIAGMLFFYAVGMIATYCVDRSHEALLWCFPMMGVAQGLFGLFTMYMPPLFPVLLRTTGAGFCYNIGRIAAACGTVFFGVFSYSKDGVNRFTLLYAGLLFFPAALAAAFLPEPPDETTLAEPTE